MNRMSAPLFVLSVFPLYWIPLGRYGNVLIGLVVIGVVLAENMRFRLGYLILVYMVFLAYVLVGLTTNIFYGHDNFVHYFKYGTYFLYFYLFTLLPNDQKIRFLKYFVYCCGALVIVVGIVRVATLAGMDVAQWVEVTRWVERRVLEDHPLITAESMTRDSFARLAYGNPTNFAYILFPGLVAGAVLM